MAKKRKRPAVSEMATACPICDQQSPIVIDREKVVPHEDGFSPNIEFWPNYPFIIHEGNGLKVYGPSGSLTLPSYEGKAAERFVFTQMHFHRPNEHVITPDMPPPGQNAHEYLEVHIVFQSLEDADRYAVIGLIVRAEPGAQYPLFETLVPLLPGFGRTAAPKVVLNLNTAFPEGEVPYPDQFYHYRGSLTTYPFTGGVHWLIYKWVIGADSHQIERFGELLQPNARPTHATTTIVSG